MKRSHSFFLTAILIAVTLIIAVPASMAQETFDGIPESAFAEKSADVIVPDYRFMWQTHWSPNGRSIAFGSEGDIFLVDVITGEVECLTADNDYKCYIPIFSHDGTEVYYSQWPVYQGESSPGIGNFTSTTQAVNIETGKTRLVIDNSYAANFSRDGRYAVYVKDWKYHAVYDFETGEERIYDFSDESTPPYFNYGHSEISPDNTYFISTYDTFTGVHTFEEYNQKARFYRINIETGDAELMDVGDLPPWYPKFSPDGSKLLYSEFSYIDEERFYRDNPVSYWVKDDSGELVEYDRRDIYMEYVFVKNPETGEFENLSWESYYMVEEPQDVYGYDSETGEYFVVEDSGWSKSYKVSQQRYEVAIYDFTTGEQIKILDAGSYETRCGSWSPDGTQICYILKDADRDDISSLYIYDLEQGAHKLVVRGEEPGQTAVEESAPVAFELVGNYPNPFNPTTTIEFSLLKAGDVSLEIYNVAGQKIREITSGKMGPGKYSVVWNGRDNQGNAVSSGVYVSKLSHGGSVATGLMTLVK